MTAKSFILHGFLILASSLFILSDVDAAKIKSVKGKRVIVNTQGDTLKKVITFMS